MYFCIISVLIFLSQLPLADSKREEACYGVFPECDYFSMTCEQDEIIRLKTLQYGRNELDVCQNMENHCLYKETCCRAGVSDCKEPFNLNHTYHAYTNCSGRHSCSTIQSPWKQMNCGASYKTSTYVSLEYDCEPVSTKIDFCGTGNAGVNSSSIEAMFDASRESYDPLKPSRECSCRITNYMDVQTIQLKIVDLRLVRNNTDKCSSATLKIDHLLNKRCVDTPLHEVLNFLFNDVHSLTLETEASIEINLSDLYLNGWDDLPVMVWVAIQASQTKDVEVFCREIIPMSTTTTTPTTPTTSSTSTTSTTTSSSTKTTTTTTSTTTTATTTTPTSTSTTTKTTQPITTIPVTVKPSSTPSSTLTTKQPLTTTSSAPPETSSAPPSTTTPLKTSTKMTTTSSLPTTTTTETTSSQPTSTESPTTTQASTKPLSTTTSGRSTELITTTSTPTESPTTIKSTTTTVETTTEIPTTSAAPTEPPSTTTTRRTTTTVTTSIEASPRPTMAWQALGGDTKEEQQKQLYLAIFVPLAILGAITAIFITWLCLRCRTPKKHSLLKGSQLNTPLEDRLIEKYTLRKSGKSFEVKPWGSLVIGKKKIPVSSIKTVSNSFHKAYPSPVYETVQPTFVPTTFLPPPQDTGESQPIHVKLGILNDDNIASQNILERTGENYLNYPGAENNGFVSSAINPLFDDTVHESLSVTDSAKQSSEIGVIIHVDNTNL